MDQENRVKERDAVVNNAWLQYVDGAITYVEFVRKAVEKVDREDCIDHNESTRGLPECAANWPFNG